MTKADLGSTSSIQDATYQQNREENEKLRRELIESKNQLKTLQKVIEELKKGT